ncbi:hypothetical protein MYAM1_000915 [Malassezia yamatoensis]|uniref:Exosome complex protein n=1 Tax=Malassezia yamatoensis TaxID=253288 RepID=A0AAJ5YQI2_9BASI|nr:hypothetical protein MYAM1_000915 [Malassezia yamatoensis]
MASYAHTVKDPTETIALLKKTADQLEEIVKSTFAQPLSTIVGELERKDSNARSKDAKAVLDGRMTGAKLLVSAAYVYLDVIWMYLKTKGVDPKTHPVQLELERVQTYFEKLKAAQNGVIGSTSTDPPSQTIDVGAANRIIAAGTGAKRKHTRFDAKGHSGEKHTKTSSTIKDSAQDMNDAQRGGRGASYMEKEDGSATNSKDTHTENILRSDPTRHKSKHTDAKKPKKKNKHKSKN